MDEYLVLIINPKTTPIDVEHVFGLMDYDDAQHVYQLLCDVYHHTWPPERQVTITKQSSLADLIKIVLPPKT